MMNQKPFRGTQINKTHPLAKGLVGAWIFNELTGEKVFDLSGNGNNGTITGASWVSDGLSFDGVDDYVGCGQKPEYNPANFTVIYSMRQKAEPGLYRGIMGNNNDDGAMTTGWGFYLLSGVVYFHLDAYNYRTGSPLSVSDRDWHTVAGIYDGSEIVMRLDDGVGTPYSISSYTSGGTALTFGRSRYFSNIGLQYVYIYNRALSTSEITWLNREPYVFFERPVNPAILYYESVGGVTIPVFAHYYNQMRS